MYWGYQQGLGLCFQHTYTPPPHVLGLPAGIRVRIDKVRVAARARVRVKGSRIQNTPQCLGVAARARVRVKVRVGCFV